MYRGSSHNLRISKVTGLLQYGSRLATPTERAISGGMRSSEKRRDFLLHRKQKIITTIGVNSYWAQGLKPPPHFCDVILSKLCFNCLHWFYAMLTNRQLDHSFPAVLDILRKGLNLQAPLDIK